MLERKISHFSPQLDAEIFLLLNGQVFTPTVSLSEPRIHVHMLVKANDKEQCQQAKKQKRFTSEAPFLRVVRVREDTGWKKQTKKGYLKDLITTHKWCLGI